MSTNKTSESISSRLIKEPLIKFLLISILIYVAYGFYGRRDYETLANDNTITITADKIAVMKFGWQQRYNRNPTDVELQKLIDARVKETVLYEEAKKMGLDKDDVVITRRVVLQYRNLIDGLITPPNPTNEELNTYYQENIATYIPDEVLSFVQIFFDPDKREESTLDDAGKALVELQNKKTLPENYRAYGDNFMLANVYTDVTPLEIRKYFGSGFAESVLQLDTNVWLGPVLSGYGTHLVYINNKQEAETPVLAEVKEAVLADYLEEENMELVKLFMENIIAKYQVVIQEEVAISQ